MKLTRERIGACGAACLLTLLLTSSASAVTVYSFTGGNLSSDLDAPIPAGSYTGATNVSGTFTIATPFAPNLSGLLPTSIILDLSFTDGRQTIDLSNFDPASLGSFIDIDTDAAGTITSFQLGFSTIKPTVVGGHFGQIVARDVESRGLFDECLAVSAGVCTSFGIDRGIGPGGTLSLVSTDVAETPLPAALPLFVSGAGLIGFLAQRRKRRRAVSP